MCNTKTEPQGKLRILDDCDVSMWIHSWLKKSLILMSNVDNGRMLYICREQSLWEIFVPSS